EGAGGEPGQRDVGVAAPHADRDAALLEPVDRRAALAFAEEPVARVHRDPGRLGEHERNRLVARRAEQRGLLEVLDAGVEGGHAAKIRRAIVPAMAEIVGPASRFSVSQRLRLHYFDWGTEARPLLLLLHGGRDHARGSDAAT